jgi:hypothetical protein
VFSIGRASLVSGDWWSQVYKKGSRVLWVFLLISMD